MERTHDPQSGPNWCDGCARLWWDAAARAHRRGEEDAITSGWRVEERRSAEEAESRINAPRPFLAPASACPRYALVAEFARLREEASGMSAQASRLERDFAGGRREVAVLLSKFPAHRAVVSWRALLAAGFALATIACGITVLL